MIFDITLGSGALFGRELKSDTCDLAAVGPDVVDLKHLRRYTQGDTALEKEVLVLFAQQVPELIASMRGATVEKDWLIAAHSLKGSARAVGAWRLADLALQAESHRNLADRTTVMRIVETIEKSAHDVQQFIAKLTAA
jgi:HPt (histidine-containing phosphotransfer) domain-containing protein